jgi:hypothetical protein
VVACQGHPFAQSRYALHAALPAHEEAIVPAVGSHFAPEAVYFVKHVLHSFDVTEPGIEQ